MQALLSLSVALFAGLMLSRAAKLVQLPAVTAYLVAGILVGPYLLGRVILPGAQIHLGFNEADFETYKLFSDVALGFIAFAIGNEFRLESLKKNGKQATVIGIAQAVFTTLLVDAALIGLSLLLSKMGYDVLPLPTAIVLGAVAAATAPAATLMVVRQYKAKGPVTNILLPIVALDDAVGLVLFAVSFGVAKALIHGEVDLLSVVLEPIVEVVGSLILGALMGYLFHLCERFFHSRSKRTAMSVVFVLLTVALSMIKFHIPVGDVKVHVGFSSLLVCMMMGTIFCNVCDFSEELMDRVERWSTPLLVLFFVVSGAELQLNVFTQWTVVLVGVVYILFRSLGKYFGAGISSRLTKCDPNIVKYLGITLLPQAGVALGMANQVKQEASFGELGAMVVNITLFAVLIYELVGPLLTKIALQKAGEIRPEEKTSARGRKDVLAEH